MDQIKIGKFIAKLRKEQELTQEQFAEILGINNRTISRWENGKNMQDISLYKIICNNKDLYFGTSNISTNLKGNYCGNKKEESCSFIRTYKVLNIQEDDDYNYLNITLKQYQAETVLVRIKRNNLLKEGKNYEFTLTTYEVFEDKINNIFKYSEITNVEETTREGMDQKMDKICVN